MAEAKLVVMHIRSSCLGLSKILRILLAGFVKDNDLSDMTIALQRPVHGHNGCEFHGQ